MPMYDSIGIVLSNGDYIDVPSEFVMWFMIKNIHSSLIKEVESKKDFTKIREVDRLEITISRSFNTEEHLSSMENICKDNHRPILPLDRVRKGRDISAIQLFRGSGKSEYRSEKIFVPWSKNSVGVGASNEWQTSHLDKINNLFICVSATQTVGSLWGELF